MIFRKFVYLLLFSVILSCLYAPIGESAYNTTYRFVLSPKDSIAAGTTKVTPALKLSKSAACLLWVQNNGAASVSYLDSLANVDYRVSPDSIKWSRPFELILGNRPAGSAAIIDSFGVETYCVYNDAMANVAFAGNAPFLAKIFPKFNTGGSASPPTGFFGGANYIQFRFKAGTRPRCANCTGNAAFVPNDIIIEMVTETAR